MDDSTDFCINYDIHNNSNIHFKCISYFYAVGLWKPTIKSWIDYRFESSHGDLVFLMITLWAEWPRYTLLHGMFMDASRSVLALFPSQTIYLISPTLYNLWMTQTDFCINHDIHNNSDIHFKCISHFYAAGLWKPTIKSRIDYGFEPSHMIS
jgi:hypothetical protein